MQERRPVFISHSREGGIGKSWCVKEHFSAELWKTKHCLDGSVMGGQTHGGQAEATARRARILAGKLVGKAT